MKRVEKLNELRVGQIAYADEKGNRKFVVRSLEDKLVPYVVATDNSCHSIRNGIWSKENEKVSASY